MTRKEILVKAGVSPQTFCPACWSHVKKILRLFESEQAACLKIEHDGVSAARKLGEKIGDDLRKAGCFK